MSSSDQYRVVFDFAQEGYQRWFPALGLIGVLIGGIYIWLGRRNQWTGFRKFFGFAFAGFAAVWSLGVLSATLTEYLQARSAYRGGTFSTVEGRVRNFRPMPYEGHQDEFFTVRTERFCYSDYGVTAGFNNSASHGGPIKEGLPVRVSYVGDTILRLEIRIDESSTSTP